MNSSETEFTWTFTAEERLRELHLKGGHTCASIAIELGCRRAQVIGRLAKLRRQGRLPAAIPSKTEIGSSNSKIIAKSIAQRRKDAGYETDGRKSNRFRFGEGPANGVPRRGTNAGAQSAAHSDTTANAKKLVDLGPRDCRHITADGYCGRAGSGISPLTGRPIGPYCEEHMTFYLPASMARIQKQKSRL